MATASRIAEVTANVPRVERRDLEEQSLQRTGEHACRDEPRRNADEHATQRLSQHEAEH